MNMRYKTILDTPWKKRIESLGENVRWSYGAGLVLLAGIARFELNYCILGWNSLTDR
jgi:hypothetical protein